MDHENSPPTAIAVRLATQADLSQLVPLQTLSLQRLSVPYYTPPQIESLIVSQARARSHTTETIVVAYQQDTLVGFAGLMVQYPEISAIFVHPDFVRQGVGRQLLQAIERIAHQKNWPTLRVLSSLTAVHFYQAQGYQPGSPTGFWSDGSVWIPCQMLCKSLAPSVARPASQPLWRQGLLVLIGVGAIALIVTVISSS